MLLKLIKQFISWIRKCTQFLHQTIYDERLEYYNQYEAYKAVNLDLRKTIFRLEERLYKYENE